MSWQCPYCRNDNPDEMTKCGKCTAAMHPSAAAQPAPVRQYAYDPPVGDPTAKEFIEAMKLLQFYTLDSQICLEDGSLIASVMTDQPIVDVDEKKLAKLGWKLRTSGKDRYFWRTFADH